MPDIPYEMKPPYAAKTDCREYHEPIDVVLTWVNGTDPEFLKQLKENEPAKASETGASRFKDMNQLKYAIRSFQKYAPWIRDIILVTNGQGTVFDTKNSPTHQFIHLLQLIRYAAYEMLICDHNDVEFLDKFGLISFRKNNYIELEFI